MPSYIYPCWSHTPRLVSSSVECLNCTPKVNKDFGPRIPPHASLSSGFANSVGGTTGAAVPELIRTFLSSTGIKPIEDTDTTYGADLPVKAMEAKCGWNPANSNFVDENCLSSVGFDPKAPDFRLDPSMVDIVTPPIRDLDFLNIWREFFQGFHVIIVQDGDPNVDLKVPEWVDYELHNRHDIKKALGENEWIISSRDASIRNFGFLISRKKYIYTIYDDCIPATDDEGYLINPLALHMRNLETPSTPYFFNTLYDPYVAGSDFVRGYPYSLRPGVPTAVSHGLWLNAPDYDAPTQLLKPTERNTNYLDVTMTIPHGIYYPMCSMNVAFSRELIGPAFMQGLMGDGQPWARYDDMFAGWASKAVADHFGVGVKSGQPYIKHNKASNPFTNLRKEYKGLWWQEDVIRFFSDEGEEQSDELRRRVYGTSTSSTDSPTRNVTAANSDAASNGTFPILLASLLAVPHKFTSKSNTRPNRFRLSAPI